MITIVDGLLECFEHLAQVMPQAAGLGPKLASLRVRLDAAKATLRDAAAAIEDAESGDVAGAIVAGEHAVAEGEAVIEGPPPSTDSNFADPPPAQPEPYQPQPDHTAEPMPAAEPHIGDIGGEVPAPVHEDEAAPV